jgi:hypothetical protein
VILGIGEKKLQSGENFAGRGLKIVSNESGKKEGYRDCIESRYENPDNDLPDFFYHNAWSFEHLFYRIGRAETLTGKKGEPA